MSRGCAAAAWGQWSRSLPASTSSAASGSAQVSAGACPVLPPLPASARLCLKFHGLVYARVGRGAAFRPESVRAALGFGAGVLGGTRGHTQTGTRTWTIAPTGAHKGTYRGTHTHGQSQHTDAHRGKGLRQAQDLSLHGGLFSLPAREQGAAQSFLVGSKACR